MDPVIIQGGMGVGISGWRLARAVSTQGQLGVVSGTAMDVVLRRRLGDGDPGGHYRRALAAFPHPAIAREALDRYLRPEGREVGEPYPSEPMLPRVLSEWQQKLLVLANFAEVFLAREGHDGPVGINLLTKVQIPNLPSLYGAMLAGVAYVLMGAGIPRDVPGALDALARHEAAGMRFDIHGATGADDETLSFDPGLLWGGRSAGGSTPGGTVGRQGTVPPLLRRPAFLPIVASNSLATMMARKSTGRIDGFVIEGPTAGGHNAPPRGSRQLNDRGEPVYGERDEVDLAKIAALGLPFWLAGGTGSPERLAAARAAGAAGIQVGTLFAYCDESGLRADLKKDVLARCANGGVDVLTDERASPTGFPFKTVSLAGSLAEPSKYEGRDRICDLGYLRTAYRRDDGRIAYRCPSEPVDTFVKKGGVAEDTAGRKCLCNALLSNIGVGQTREDGRGELPLLTSGDDLRTLGTFLAGRSGYSAADVLSYLLAEA
jgi:nitronate monooxygenase